MSISIRLKKMGKRGQPFYRVVVADTLKKHEGDYIENLGWYNPLVEGENYQLKQDRLDYWIGQGARISNTVKSLVLKNRKRAPQVAAADSASTPA